MNTLTTSFILVSISLMSCASGGRLSRKGGKCYATCMTPDGQYTEWRKVICSEDITKGLVNRLSRSLHANGYLAHEDISDQMTEKIKSALVQYQRDNDLLLGPLTIETLKKQNVID